MTLAKVAEALEAMKDYSAHAADVRRAEEGLKELASLRAALAESIRLMRTEYPEDCMWRVRELLAPFAEEKS